MCVWEHGIVLHPKQGNPASSLGEGHAKQGNPASSLGEGEVSWVISSCARNLGYILELQREWPFETPVCLAKSGLLCTYYGHFRNLN